MSATNTAAAPKVDLYQVVTDRIITALESGTQPWRKPWNASAPDVTMGRPLRENGVAYTGINTVNLWVAAASRGLANPYWLTWNRVTELGGAVRKGAKSEMAFYVGAKLVRDGDTIAPGETVSEGDDGVRRISFLKYYRVFNASEIDGLPERYSASLPAPAPIDHANPEAAAFIDAMGADISYGGNRAYYAPGPDAIRLPPYISFDPKAAFYSTAFHELVHWTKHESRLNRDCGQVKRWGDESYAMEELVAELGAAFLCADHGLANVTEDQSAAYLQSWLKVLKHDNRAVFKAATMAEKAAGYLNTLAASKPAPAPVAPALPAPQPASEPAPVAKPAKGGTRKRPAKPAPAPVKAAAATVAKPAAKPAKGGARKRPATPAPIAAGATRVETTVAAIVADLPAVEAIKGRPVLVLTDDGALPGELVNAWRLADDSLRLGARLTQSQGRYKRGQCLFGDAGKIAPFGYLGSSYRWTLPATVATGPAPVTEPAPVAKPAKGGARKRPATPAPAPVAAPVAQPEPAPEPAPVAAPPAPPAPAGEPVTAPRRRAAGTLPAVADQSDWPTGAVTSARERPQRGRGGYAHYVAAVAALTATPARVARMPAATCNGYDSFVSALAIAKAGAVAEGGLSWAVKPGLSLMVTVPAKWVACKVFGGTSRAPRDQRVPAPRFWPGGALPAGAVIAPQTVPETGPILFGDDRAKMGQYSTIVRKRLGWQFSAERGGWHRVAANDATAIRGAA